MTKFFKVTLAMAALLTFATAGAQANEVTGFGPSFTNKAPVALGEAESDPVVAAQDPAADEFNPDNLNEITPAAGGDVTSPAAPVVTDESAPAASPVMEEDVEGADAE